MDPQLAAVLTLVTQAFKTACTEALWKPGKGDYQATQLMETHRAAGDPGEDGQGSYCSTYPGLC